MLNPDHRKSGETILLNDAIDLMEGAFNYYYGFINNNYSKVETQTTTVKVDFSTNSQILISKIQELYIQLNNQIYNTYNSIEFEQKHLKFVDIEFTTVENENFIKLNVGVGQVASNKSITWVNKTPFNDQTDQTWLLSIYPPSNDHYEFYEQSNATIAINELVNITHANTDQYVYLVEETDYLENHFPYEEIYNSTDIDLAAPNEYPGSLLFEYGFADANGAWEFYGNMPNGDQINFGYEGIFVNYKVMNKLYNVCMYTIETYKPYMKEAINSNLTNDCYVYFHEGNYYGWASGKFKVTYASKYRRIFIEVPREPCLM
ncbi:MAG: hypothetical protein JEZ09_05155 [Salinivirgaceae bacterium]|nr:hypothetical protein [Salinivirgaceae bacterium]